MTKRITIVPLGVLFSAGLAMGWPGLASAASCTISPQNPTVKVGGSVSWYATPKDISSPTYAWKFQEGTPSSSSNSTQTVRYEKAGTFTTSLQLTRGDTKVTCSTTVKVGTQDTTPPTVSIRSSAPGPFNPPGSVTLSATASDNSGTVSKVEFYDNGNLKATDTSSPFTYPWSFTASDAGTHVWTARAYDAANNAATSSGLTLVVNGATSTSNVSINSTSQSMLDAAVSPGGLKPVTEAPKPRNANSLSPAANTGTTGYQVLAINDLGMHCGDRDTRIASILPPFQVLLSQVIRKGAEPKILGLGEAQVWYSAASNPNDPILTAQTGEDGYPFTGRLSGGSVFKTNFWDVAYQAYNPFYPPGVLRNFYDANVPANNRDLGLPVPNVEHLYITSNGQVIPGGTGNLTAVQHAMPGIAKPYVDNVAQFAEEHYGDKPFFVGFPFGYVASDVNWFEGAGIPLAAFDDAGRENPYPLVRVQAKSGNTVLATVDTVLPISGEANCQGCHAATGDGGNGAGIKSFETLGLDVTASIDDPMGAPNPDVPVGVSVEWASDLNILRLHDKKHGAKYNCAAPSPDNASCLESRVDPGNGRAADPVVCQRCHYTPALDLAQVGPKGPENDAANANGRDQWKNKSMSNVMHSHHATVTDASGNVLFPDMPAPTADSTITGLPTNQVERESILGQTCYTCHPGNKTKCMRGAMADGGMVCQDCHGQMAQVGNDFSKNVSPTNPGKFILAKDFYNPSSTTPRVPWANEPGCGSCHTGDATSNLAGSPTDVIVNALDANLRPDNIRLLRAYRTDDANAKPIVPTNKRFAEPVVPASFNGFANPGAGNPQLYRVSTGHGGVMCEGCHGATHAEWDSDSSPLKNDDVTANQLQGHSGTVMECNTCHLTGSMEANTQGGPHGMHLVNDSRFWREAHKGLAESENAKANGGSCAACHGADHRGTVLSRAPVDRSFTVEGSSRTVKAGEPVSCDLCHSLDKSFEGSSSGGGDD